jgi:multicomponent Na+:H+ antiporter subunit G
MTDWIAALLLGAGGAFCLIAGVGVVRLPDIYMRMHAATKAGTLGLGLICGAVMVKAESWQNVVEALFVFLFMIATAPVGAHLIGRAAYRTRVPMAPRTQSDPDCEPFRLRPARPERRTPPPVGAAPRGPGRRA